MNDVLSEYMCEHPNDNHDANWYPDWSKHPYPAPCDDIKELENDKDDCNNVQYAEAYVV